jgi:hypothetical protein
VLVEQLEVVREVRVDDEAENHPGDDERERPPFQPALAPEDDERPHRGERAE